MNTNISKKLCCCFFLAAPMACTNLDVPVYDKATDFWRTEDEIAAGVAPAYALLRNMADFSGVYALNEVSSDEIIVPRRGGAWNDGGVWEQLWKQTWTPNTPIIESAWQILFKGIVGVNRIIKSVQDLKTPPSNLASITAELKTIRAFYYYQALDLFGNVPIAIDYTSDVACLSNSTRNDVFEFVENELLENLSNLPEEVSTKTYGRATKWFAYSVLAKLYLNAEVYTGTQRLTNCISSCNAILGSGNYFLEPDFFSNFKVSNENSKENIFVYPFDKNGLNDFTFIIEALSLHYNSDKTFGLKWQWGFGGFNGFCSTAGYVNQFSTDDARRKMFLIGQQYVNQIENPANLQYDNLGNLLIFDPDITSFSIQPPKTETAGARCIKWELDKTNGIQSNDFSVYRLSDIILMKAEAQLRLGDANNSLITLNTPTSNGVSIRSRTGLDDFTLSDVTLDGILAERARELSWEGHRRNDLIRFGHFLDARIPEKEVSENFRTLYPIPRAVLLNNSCLTQNPGYN